MADIFKLYISAASDLNTERDLLNRSVTEIPVTLVWQINLSPLGEKKVDEKLILDADLHILLLGMDIRAPIGYEWYISKQLGHKPYFFIKEGINRTPAAGNFIRSFSDYSNWHTYDSLAHLRFQALTHIGQTIRNQADYFDIKQKEYENLSTFIEGLEIDHLDQISEIDGGTGENSIIFSRERFTPKGGILIQDPEKNDLDKQD